MVSPAMRSTAPSMVGSPAISLAMPPAAHGTRVRRARAGPRPGGAGVRRLEGEPRSHGLDAPGVVGLIGEQRDGDQGHARGECAEEGAGTDVADHGAGVGENLALGDPGLDAYVGGDRAERRRAGQARW